MMDKLIRAISEKKFDTAKDVLDERISVVVNRKLFEVKKSILAKISEAEIPIPRPSPIPTPNQTNAAKGAIRKELGIQRIIKNHDNSPASWKEKTGGELPSNPPRNPSLRQTPVERITEETRAEKYAAKKAEWEAKEPSYKKQKVGDKRLDALKAKLGITTKKFDDDMHSKVAKIGQYSRGSLEENASEKQEHDEIEDHKNLMQRHTMSDNKYHVSGLYDKHNIKLADLRKKYAKPEKESKLSEKDLLEASFKIVRARVRGGKIQRRKKVSTRPGYTFRGGKLIRMSPAERRKRKLGARRGKIKRRSKMNRSNMKRARSNRKRNALGLNRKTGRR